VNAIVQARSCSHTHTSSPSARKLGRLPPCKRTATKHFDSGQTITARGGGSGYRFPRSRSTDQNVPPTRRSLACSSGAVFGRSGLFLDYLAAHRLSYFDGFPVRQIRVKGDR